MNKATNSVLTILKTAIGFNMLIYSTKINMAIKKSDFYSSLGADGDTDWKNKLNILEDFISINKGLKPLACASYFYKMP